jgi:NAD(P)-dependent dehydrogenase (short-subunit alcohol dehydrogenase family)
MRPLAIVTAGGKRLGRALSLRLGALGHDVAVLFHSSGAEAAETCSALKAQGADAEPIACDLAHAEAIPAALAQIQARFGRPASVLVNNASIFEWDDIHTISAESLAQHFKTNLFAPVLLCKEMLGAKPAAPGLIVNILDQKIFNLNADHLSYTLAKYALYGFTLTMAKSLAPDFRVCAIAPGYVLPAAGREANFERLHDATPLKRGPDPEDIAYALEFLVKSPSVTGNVLIVDGGSHLTGAPRDFAFL